MLLSVSRLNGRTHSGGLELASDFLLSGASVQVRKELVRPRWAHLARGWLPTRQVLRRARVLAGTFTGNVDRDTDDIPWWQGF